MRKVHERPLRVVCLPIGIEWSPPALAAFTAFKDGVEKEAEITIHTICKNEKEALAAVQKIGLDNLSGAKYDCLLLPVMQGSTVRRGVLAASSAGLPVVIWCCNQKHSLASASLIKQALDQLDVMSVLIHGEKADHIEAGLASIKSAAAISRLKTLRIGKIGELHGNLLGSEVTPLGVHKIFGPWIVPLHLSLFFKKMEKVEKKKVQNYIETLKDNFDVLADEDFLFSSAKVHAVFSSLAQEYDVDCFTVDCWNEFIPLLGISPCPGFAFSEYDIVCEGDILAAVLMKAGKVMTGNHGYFGDFYSYNGENGLLISRHCGGHHSLHGNKSKRVVITGASPPGTVDNAGKVFSCRPEIPPISGTVAMLYGDNGRKLFLSGGSVVKTDYEDQMNVSFKVRGDPGNLLKESPGNHYMFFPGEELETFSLWAEWLKLSIFCP